MLTNMDMNTTFAEKELDLLFLAKLAASMFLKTAKYIAPIAFFIFIPVYFTSALAFRNFDVTAISELPASEMMDFITNEFFPASLTATGLYLLIMPIVYMAVYSIIKHIFDNREIKISRIIDDSIFSWWKLVATTLIYIALMLLTMFLIVVPIYLAIIFCFFVPVIVFSGKWGLSALSESRNIIKGRFLKTLAFLIFISIIRYTINYVLGLVVLIIPININNLYAAILVSAIITSLTAFFELYAVYITGLWYKNWDLFRRTTTPQN